MRYDVAIIGAGPGGLACAIAARQRGLSYIVLEKGSTVLQGIIDTYPRGKKVYPTIPKGETGPFPITELAPSPERDPVEEYVAKIAQCVKDYELTIRLQEEFQDIVKEKSARNRVP